MRRALIGGLGGIFVISLCFLSLSYGADPSPLDWIKGKLNAASSTSLSDTNVDAGLKEALKVGIENTIKLLGQKDGYLGNQAVRILLPQSIKTAEVSLRKMGLGSKVDEFILSMNRAAEKSAPLAADVFSSAIVGISFDDAKKILEGGNTAATEYLKSKTSGQLLEAFKPVVRKSMDEYAVTKKYEELVSKIQTMPFAGKLSGYLDINKYVSSKALDGLFKVLGEQEAKIRTDPAARITSLLKEVFK